MHYAAAEGKLDVAQVLVQSGAFLEAQDNVGHLNVMRKDKMNKLKNGAE